MTTTRRRRPPPTSRQGGKAIGGPATDRLSGAGCKGDPTLPPPLPLPLPLPLPRWPQGLSGYRFIFGGQPHFSLLAGLLDPQQLEHQQHLARFMQTGMARMRLGEEAIEPHALERTRG